MELSPRRGADPGVTIFLDDDEIREPRIAAWLASLEARGGEQIEPPLVAYRDAPVPYRPSFLALNLGLTVVAGFWCAAQLVAIAADGFAAPLPLSSLVRTEGTMQAGSCLHSRSSELTHVQIQTSSGIVDTALPCTIHDRQIADIANRHVEFYRDPRPLHHTSDTETLQFVMDGVMVQRFEDTHAFRHDWRWSTLGQGVFTAAAILSTLLLMIPGRRKRP